MWHQSKKRKLTKVGRRALILFVGALVVIVGGIVALSLPKARQTARHATPQPAVARQLLKKGDKTYAVAGSKKLTGMQTISGKTYYFDPATAAEVGQMRSMTGDYWQLSSMTQAYPDLAAYQDLSVTVETSQQRAYIRSGNQVIYVMYTSSGGPDGGTPSGTYAIEAERGDTFYNAQEGEGANYWVSWLDHGIYLFHSIPINAQGKYIASAGAKLGHSADSHGCVRLSVSDAKWLYNNIPQGTKVIIK